MSEDPKEIGEELGPETPKEPPARKGRGRGYIPDQHDPRDLKARTLFGARRGVPPEAMALEGHVPGIQDQQWTSACVDKAVTGAVDTRLRYVQSTRPFVPRWPAPLVSGGMALYQLARILDRDRKEDPLTDEGCSPRTAMEAARKYGIPPANVWPFDPDHINDEPPLDVLEGASAARLDKYWRIDSEGQERCDDFAQALSLNYPVAFGTVVDQAFEDHVGKDPVTAHDPRNALGGHMLYFVGYAVVNGRRLFRGVNSWSSAWGDLGMFWADEDFVRDPDLTDAYVIQCSVA